MTTNIRNATDLWMEAGPMARGPHCHIAVPKELAEFFDAQSRDAEIIHVRLPNGTVLPRPLSYRGADDAQPTDMWYLALPTERMGAPSYAGRVIRLTRHNEASRDVYLLHVVDARSSAVAEWDMTARSSGNIGEIAGPHLRRFGYW
jgi:hypothetical protein